MFSLSEIRNRASFGMQRVQGRARSQTRWSERIRSAGFSLIELMVAVAIIAILSRIALSSYHSSVMKSNRSAAKTALLDLASREERFYSLKNYYSSTPSDLYGQGTTITFPINVPATGAALYTIAAPTITAFVATSSTPPTFTITAQPTGGQAGDTCGSFVVNSAGQQSVTGTGSCW